MTSMQRVAATAAAAFLLTSLWVGLLLTGGREPIDLMYPGEKSGVAPLVAEEFGEETLIADSNGYDGAVFWAQARDFPDMQHTASFMAEPRYRFQRILTPAIASIGGDSAGPAIILLLLGPVGVALGAGAIADLAVRHRRPAWIGLLFFFPLLLASAWGLSEPMAFGLGLVGVALCDRLRLGWAALAFTLGALAREPVAFMAIASGAGLLVARRVTPRQLWPLAVPAAVTAGWMLYLTTVFPPSPSTDRLNPLGLLDAGPTGQLLGLATIAFGIAAAWTWRDIPAVWPIGLLFVALTLSYGGELFRLQVVYRAGAPAFALGLAGLLAAAVRPEARRQRWREQEPSVDDQPEVAAREPAALVGTA
jgi:hypothetical protein